MNTPIADSGRTGLMQRLGRPFEGRAALLWACIGVAILVGRQIRKALLPYLLEEDVTTTLREDDYWSFTGGFIRRALLGEVLFQGSSLTGTNISAAVSVACVIAYGFVVYRVLRRLLHTLAPVQVAMLALTPLLIPFKIDREVFLLLPLLAFATAGTSNLRWTIAGSVAAVAALVHEFALALYVPLMLAVHASSGRLLRVSPALLVAGALVVIAVPLALVPAAPTLVPEQAFWPRFGITGLDQSWLYAFAEMRFSEVLRLHAGYMTASLTAFLNVAFVLASFWFLVTRVATAPAMRLAAPFVLLPFFVLTVDYGRYAYVLFAFFVLGDRIVSEQRAATAAATERPRWTPLTWVVLVGMSLAPVAFWVGDPAPPTPIRLFGVVFKVLAKVLE